MVVVVFIVAFLSCFSDCCLDAIPYIKPATVKQRKHRFHCSSGGVGGAVLIVTKLVVRDTKYSVHVLGNNPVIGKKYVLPGSLRLP